MMICFHPGGEDCVVSVCVGRMLFNRGWFGEISG